MDNFEVKYDQFNRVDIDYYIERARVERSAYIASLFRKAFFKKSEKGSKVRVAYNLQQSPAL
ncbi:hypothetical protein KQ940_10125 [Marinobacterium sp. D7]|uniref:RSP_7527 family protein n=1 Tax=Marinobacterium ramblicola TaxID=2849041 RepID=UPI001C2CF943|nr:hypothetical protein [Marinobacterium ramblicola]MBV1788413.1 hypothetical protein [Marinobacterium ramblicola]